MEYEKTKQESDTTEQKKRPNCLLSILIDCILVGMGIFLIAYNLDRLNSSQLLAYCGGIALICIAILHHLWIWAFRDLPDHD